MNDSTFYIIMVGTCVVGLILGFGPLYIEAFRNRKLDSYGATTTATITETEGDSLTASYWATAMGKNPHTGAMSSFTAHIDSSVRKGGSVEVVFDPHNPRKCYFRRVTTEDCFRQEQAHRLRQEQAHRDALKERDRYRMM